MDSSLKEVNSKLKRAKKSYRKLEGAEPILDMEMEPVQLTPVAQPVPMPEDNTKE